MKGYTGKRDFAKLVNIPKPKTFGKTLTEDQQARLKRALSNLRLEEKWDTMYGVCHPAGRDNAICFYESYSKLAPTTEVVQPRLEDMIQKYELAASDMGDVAPIHTALTHMVTHLKSLKEKVQTDPKNVAAFSMRYHFTIMPIIHNVCLKLYI